MHSLRVKPTLPERRRSIRNKDNPSLLNTNILLIRPISLQLHRSLPKEPINDTQIGRHTDRSRNAVISRQACNNDLADTLLLKVVFELGADEG